MEPPEPAALLSRYAEHGCQEAFAMLMRRYADLVHSAALRRLNGDAAAAEDVVQRVFTELARQARRFKTDSGLGGWLYRCAVNYAADLHKAETRRRTREITAAAMNADEKAPDSESGPWSEIAPLLDQAMLRLPGRDREALVLRFFEGLPLSYVGKALGISEDAAQKRISRALDRLRGLLQRRGILLTSAGLSVSLAGHAAAAAPAGMVAALLPYISHPAVGSSAPSLLALQSAMNAKPLIAATVVILAAGAAFPLYHWMQESSGEPETSGADSAAVQRRPARNTLTASPDEAAAAARKPAAETASAGTAEPPAEGARESSAEKEKTIRQRAEEVTMQRYTEKMDRLQRKLNLTPEQKALLAAHHLAQRDRWIEYMTGASTGKADPQYYQLEAGYREDVPPAIQATLSPEQLALYREHDTNKRTNHIEAVTSGEINYLAQRLDLDQPRKDALFDSLAGINSTDLFSDLGNVQDLASIGRQADQDLARRRESFAAILDSRQMTVWEEIATGYRRELLQRFGHRETATADASKDEVKNPAG